MKLIVLSTTAAYQLLKCLRFLVKNLTCDVRIIIMILPICVPMLSPLKAGQMAGSGLKLPAKYSSRGYINYFKLLKFKESNWSAKCEASNLFVRFDDLRFQFNIPITYNPEHC